MNPLNEANQYDKIVKENIAAFLPALIARVLNIDVAESEELSAELQYTLERKPDVLRRIVDQQGRRFVLHIEFQSANDARMLRRMLLYRAMLFEQYVLPVRQVVIYLGAEPATMTTTIEQVRLSFSYTLLSLIELPAVFFLSSRKPEEVILALLADFGTQSPTEILTAIVERLEETSPGRLAFGRYMKQLRVLANLRKLVPKIEELMDGLMSFFVEEEDVLFVRGERRGEARGEARGKAEAKNEAALSLLTKTDYAPAQIADLLEMPLDQVLALLKPSA